MHISMPCERQRQGMLKLSLFFSPSRPPVCSNFLGMEAYLLSMYVHVLLDQGALRWIVSGTGAVPTDSVTLLSMKES
jgi:hypothetical protein